MSPSSVDREPRATKAGNARIHGMEQVTTASIAYAATIVRNGLTLSSYSLTICCLHSCDFPFRLRQFSLERTLLLILRGSINQYMTSWRILRSKKRYQSLWLFGTCVWPSFFSLILATNICFHRQIFPEHSSAKRPITKDSVLSRLKEARALLKAHSVNSPRSSCTNS